MKTKSKRITRNSNGTVTVYRPGTTYTEYKPTKASRKRIKRIKQ